MIFQGRTVKAGPLSCPENKGKLKIRIYLNKDMEILLKTKSAGKNSAAAIIGFLALSAFIVICVYNGFTENHLWWLGLILAIPLAVINFMAARDEFAGSESIGIENNHLVILYDRWNMPQKKKEIRIPMQDIVEIVKSVKSRMEDIIDTLDELMGRGVSVDH